MSHLSEPSLRFTRAWGNGCARLVLALALCAALGALAPNAAPSVSAQTGPAAGAPVTALVSQDGTVNLNRGFSGALDLQGWDVTLDARRGPILTRQRGTLGAAQPSPFGAADLRGALADVPQPVSFWLPLPHNGLINSVSVLLVNGNDLYVGGIFNATNDGAVTGLNNIAKFSGGVWSAWQAPSKQAKGSQAARVRIRWRIKKGPLVRTADRAAAASITWPRRPAYIPAPA